MPKALCYQIKSELPNGQANKPHFSGENNPGGLSVQKVGQSLVLSAMPKRHALHAQEKTKSPRVEIFSLEAMQLMRSTLSDTTGSRFTV